jgi:hypothetical protein
MDAGDSDEAPMRKVGEDVGVAKEIGELAVATTTRPVVVLAASEPEVMIGIVAEEVTAAPADTRLVWRAKQAGSVGQIVAGGSTAPVLACWS